VLPAGASAGRGRRPWLRAPGGELTVDGGGARSAGRMDPSSGSAP